MKKLSYVTMAIATFAMVAFLLLYMQPLPAPSSAATSRPQASAQPIAAADQRLAAAQLDNPDTVAWLTVPGTNIDGSVQQGPDNEFYLRRDSLGAYSNEGCFYADFECSFSPLSTNTIIYGHTFTGTGQDPNIGFGQLQQFLDPKFADQNNTIFLSVQDQMMTFEIVSVGLADAATDQVSILAQPSTEQLSNLIDLANARNVLKTTIEQEIGGSLLTLSTCTAKNNERLLVVAQLTK